MKKNILYYLCFLLIGGLTISSCTKDEDKNPFAEITDIRGGVINITNVDGFFNLGDAAAKAVVFDLANHEFGDAISSVTLSKSVNGGAAIEETVVTSFPASFNFSLEEALVGSGVAAEDLAPGDNIVYSVSNVVTSSGTYSSGRTVKFDVSCPGQLTGTFDAVTTATGVFASPDPYVGTVRMEDTGGGKFKVYSVEPTSGMEFEDPSFGAYYAGYGTTDQGGLPNGADAGTVQVSEICGVLSFIGKSQWDEAYKFNSLSVDGADLNFSWENDYGESGNVKLTRTDGTNWPSGLRL
ncbi:MAG: hypothetical protein NXI23_21115 [Bacteroidetes bacterium]|jgi:hypothetical protein|nr:hypothetical protein [Bacteroidota bacterium]